MRRPLVLLGLGAVIVVSTAGCGSDDAATDVTPRSTPALVAPEQSGIPASTTATGTTTTDTTTTATTSSTADGQTATPQTTTPSTATPDTGGAATPPAGTGGTTGGTGTATTPSAGNGTGGADLTEFCKQSPGAC